MSESFPISRRRFMASGISATALAMVNARSFARFAADDSSALGPEVPLTDQPGWKDQGIENLAKSPYAKLRQIPVRAVTIKDGFWGSRRRMNVTKSIPSMHDLLEANGRMNNFRRLTGNSKDPQRGPVYSDSDVYKWTEAAGFALQSGDHPELRSMVEKVISNVVAAQQSDGYLNTYYVGDRASQRM